MLSLKAELLRKQQEVSKTTKPSATDPFQVFNSKRPNDKKKHSAKPKNVTEPVPEVSTKRDEDVEMLAKSKRVLEAKARLYDRMTASGGSLNSDDRCLVRFNQKKQDERTTKPIESSSESSSDDEHDNSFDDDDDNKWTEYTDCLGRTRKCLKEDLEFFRKKDQDLEQVAKERNPVNNEKPAWFVDTKGISSSDLPLYTPPVDDDDTLSMISKSTKAEEMRQHWELKEQENVHRDQIHYQDVLFDEARTHGVGYFAFSNDQSERLKQQAELETEREKTLDAQKQRDQIRINRERIIAERVFAAKNRQRARVGLPPLDREELMKAEEKEKVDESKEERKRKKKEEKERLKREEEDRKREEQRLQHLRPWDQGKDGVRTRKPLSDSDNDEWTYKPEKPEPMSQQQWNEMKREERNPEFAPVEQPSNRFTTIKPKTFKRRNAEPVGNMFSEPIRNELDGNDFPVDDDRGDDRSKRTRAEIPPPPTFDYYGPTSSGSRPKTHNPKPDISASIDAGLRFLRDKADKSTIVTKQAWVTNTSYEQA